MDVEAIRKALGYSNTRLTLAEKKFVRRLIEEAAQRGEAEATERLIRRFDTAFIEHRLATA